MNDAILCFTARAATFGMLFFLGVEVGAAPEIATGDLDGVPYFVAAPRAGDSAGWLLVAHGYRPADYPLSADLPAEEAPWSDWLEAGWTILSTAYRRNGWIVA